MIFFSIPKPFDGDTGSLQRRSIKSWLAIADRVILFGDDPTVAAAAADLGVEHVGGGPVSERGTPFLDHAFREAGRRSGGADLCLANADVIFGADLLEARDRTRERFDRFLLVGQTRDLPVRDEELAQPAALRARALTEGVSRGPTAIDWFLFTHGVFHDVPAFLVGRASFDNWLVWRARQSAVVVDVTDTVVAIHQSHDYSHLPGGLAEAYYGPEAEHNLRLAGGRRRVYTLYDASHVLGRTGAPRRNPGAIFRSRERARKVLYKLGRR